jgi:hypothetical protein
MSKNKKAINEAEFSLSGEVHAFNTAIAVLFRCANTATIINDLIHWRKKNIGNNTNCFEGNYWTYMTVKAWNEKYPYITPDVIRGILDRLEENNYIVTGNFNETKYDRTKWYALTEKACTVFNVPFGILPNGDSKNPNGIGKKPNPFTINPKSNSENPEPIPNNYLIQDLNTHANFENVEILKDFENQKNCTEGGAAAARRVDLKKRKRYDDEAGAVYDDLKTLYKSDEQKRGELSLKLESIGVTDTEKKRETVNNFLESFSVQFLENRRKAFNETNTDKPFETFASLTELHQQFLNSFRWLKKIDFGKIKQRTDKAQKAQQSEVKPIKAQNDKPTDGVEKLQIEQLRKWILAGRVDKITIDGVDSIDLRLNYVTGAYESVNLTRVKTPLNGFHAVRVQTEK